MKMKKYLLIFLCHIYGLVCQAQPLRLPPISSGSINGHEYVDLGLSVKWATCNIGASKPEENGNYYAWGETVTKNSYSWSNYFDAMDGEGENFYQYFTSTYRRHGLNCITPESGRDAARVYWGGTWRLPTKDEIQELLTMCTWYWDTINGKNGFVVTGPNRKYIFLPAAGCISDTTHHIYNKHALYQTSDLKFQQYLWGLYFISESKELNTVGRQLGTSIRPVSF